MSFNHSKYGRLGALNTAIEVAKAKARRLWMEEPSLTAVDIGHRLGISGATVYVYVRGLPKRNRTKVEARR